MEIQSLEDSRCSINDLGGQKGSFFQMNMQKVIILAHWWVGKRIYVHEDDTSD